MKLNWNKTLLSIVVLLVLLGSVVGAQPRKTTLNVSYNPMPLNVPSIVAKEKNLLEDELASLGVKVNYRQFLAGYQMTEAMAAGELDLSPVMGGTSTLTSAAGGRNLRIVAAYGRSPGGFALVTKADSPAGGVKDLLGKRIALPVGTEVHYLLAKLLEQEGKSLADVEVVNMLVPDGVSALMGGHVDAAMVVEPVLTRLSSAGQIKVIRDGVGVFSGMTLITASDALVSQHPELIEAFLRAHNRAIAYIEANPEETLALVAEATGLPENIVQRIMPKYTFDPTLDEGALSSLMDTADFLYAHEIIRRPVDVEALLWR